MKLLLQPLAVLAIWTMIVWAWLYATRMTALKKAGIDLKGRHGTKGGDLDGVLPDKTQWVAHNYNHLLEQPPLFYAVVIALAMLGDMSEPTRMIAWAYVGLRIAHSLVQILWNRALVRWALFMLASIGLFLLCLRLLAGVFIVA
ncbi:MAPEG family protein [Sphingomicrobium sediminis]|uniref:MAPEG family protein n=1 Tax=Sphingomicrobium sediminis TaxID=2950949 RepID=A0A9X2EJP2_9SPHN|nr:MAPEG family protein [Sphingomicrobium sediminis]MCM8556819.1 MAPEG family protein [Sphingomicrobium sediminis]